MAIVAVAGVTPANAQSASKASAKASTDKNTVDSDDIVVTARGREEKLSEVPVSAVVTSGESLRERNFNSLPDLMAVTPGVQLKNGLQNNTFNIRGIESAGNPVFDSPVGTFSDGVYRGRSRITDALFFDMERIEVLKGPQSTYFGNNSIAGAINLLTRKPGDKLEGDARALYGTHGQYAFEAGVGGPITETLGVRVSGLYSGQHSDVRNVKTGNWASRVRDVGGRAIFEWKPSDAFESMVKIEAGDHRIKEGYAEQPLVLYRCPEPFPFPTSGRCAGAAAAGLINDKHKTYIDPGAKAHIYNFEASWTNTLHAGDVDITSISARSYYNSRSNFEDSVSPNPAGLSYVFPENYKQFSQDLRAQSSFDGPLNFIVGAYYMQSTLDGTFYITLPSGATADPRYLSIEFILDQRDKLYTTYGALSYKITDALTLNAGLRQTWFRRNATGSNRFRSSYDLFAERLAPPVGAPTLTDYSVRDDALQPSASLQYKFSPTVMAYASYQKGYKSPGSNAYNYQVSAANNFYAAEHADAYEIGLKGSFFDNRLAVNLAIYRTDYKNQQVLSGFNPNGDQLNVPRAFNIPGTRPQGIEADATIRLSDDFKFGTSIVYNAGKFTDYTVAEASATRTNCRNASYYAAHTALCQGVFGGTSPADIGAFDDLTGKRIKIIPQFSGTFWADYVVPLTDSLNLNLNSNVYWSTSYYPNYTPDPIMRPIGGYMRVDARITLETSDKRWAFDIVGQNLTGVTPLSPDAAVVALNPVSLTGQIRYRF